MKSRLLGALSSALVVATINPVSGLAVEFLSIGALPDGAVPARGYGLSANGRVVVGDGVSGVMVPDPVTGLLVPISDHEAYRWDADGGFSAGLGDLSGGAYLSGGHSTSYDGSVVVGYTHSGRANGSTEAFRWTESTGMLGLGDLTGGFFSSQAWDVSANGHVIVGQGSSASGVEAFRWTEDKGMMGLGDLPGLIFNSDAQATSADGSVVVGQSVSALGNEAFRWTEAKGMVGLGDLTGGGFNSQARDVSADGSVVVGTGVSEEGGEAFRWTEETGMIGLGDLAGGQFRSSAYGVSADGSILVGDGWSTPQGTPGEAFIWDEVHGMRSIKMVLQGAGIDLTGWELESAQDVSANGLIVVGYGRNPDGEVVPWVANLVPIPPAVWLFVSGLLGLIVISIKNEGSLKMITPS
jgi:probable HAF family extracellular repeat protein